MFSMFILFAFKSITGNTPLELEAPGRKTQTSDYHINKNLKELIMFPKSHSTDILTSLIALL